MSPNEEQKKAFQRLAKNVPLTPEERMIYRHRVLREMDTHFIWRQELDNIFLGLFFFIALIVIPVGAILFALGVIK